MKIEDTIYALNKHIKQEREKLNIEDKATLILHKVIMPHKTIKAYKDIEIVLWYVEGRKKERILTEHLVTRMLEGQEDKVLDAMYTDLMFNIFNMMETEMYYKIIKREV